MKVGIMQPYFLPYLGYFQLLTSVDKFVIYDDIKYTKKGWINRNRFLRNNKPETFSIALEKQSDYLDVRERNISREFDRARLFRVLQGAYAKSPYFSDIEGILLEMINFETDSLFEYIKNSLEVVCSYLEIDSHLIVSSSLSVDRDLTAQERVIATCKEVGATTYINPIGGAALYSEQAFENAGISLQFLSHELLPYPQYDEAFVEGLSIIDVMSFNRQDECRQLISRYTTVKEADL